MAQDDMMDVIRRMQSGQSAGQALNRSYLPAANAVNSTPQGQIIQGSGAGSAGYGTGQGSLSPDQNPAYQAAVSKGRPARSGYTMIQTPSGGTMAVPIGQSRKYTDLLYKGNPTADTGFQRPNAQAAFDLGNTSAIPQGNTPYERSFRMGAQGDGAVVQPGSPGLGYQVGQLASNAAQYLGNRVAGLFGGGNTTAQNPSPAPAPAPTMTPSPNLYGYSQPRRYFDF